MSLSCFDDKIYYDDIFMMIRSWLLELIMRKQLS